MTQVMGQCGRIGTGSRVQGGDAGGRGLSAGMHAAACHRVAPIYLQARDKGSGTAMFLAMSELQRMYPALSELELETLFFGVMREIERAGHVP